MTKNTPENVVARLVPQANGCLFWPGKPDQKGYGRVMIDGRQWLVHRLVYLQVKGPIPDGMVLDHRCHQRLCSNPDHLEAVTHRTNILRGQTRAAQQILRTVCPAGHPYTAENTIIYKGGNRRCRTCHYAASSACRKRKREGTQGEYQRRNTNTVEAIIGRLDRVDSGCWDWPPARIAGGYGIVKLAGKVYTVHRLVYEQLRGPIPAGLVLDHRCGNTCCANPDHLEPVTNGENSLRGNGPAAQKARQTHCLRGHLFAGDNLHINPQGHRICRSCNREDARRWRETHPDYQRRYRPGAPFKKGGSGSGDLPAPPALADGERSVG